MARIRPVKAGDVISEGLLNRIVDQLERFRNLSTSSPYIRLWDGPYGKSIALALPQQTWARLSGSSSPYSFVEVRDGPGGTWVDMPNGDSGSANVYEVNGKAGLAGKVVPITWTAAGDWRFQHVAYGTPDFAWTFNVFGCMGTGLAGATIELRQSGVLIDSCVTGDGTGGTTLGQCVLTVPAGTYDVTITGPSGAGYADSVSSQAIAATKTTNTTLVPDSEHACWSCCDYPLPDAIHSTDSDGPFTLTRGTDGLGRPYYEYLSTTPVGESCTGLAFEQCFGCVSPSVAYKGYRVTLLSNCTASLSVISDVIIKCANLILPDGRYPCSFRTEMDQPSPVFGGTVPVSSANCKPLNLVFTVPTTIAGCIDRSGGPFPMPGGGGLMAFTA